jgi:hypothetical protein
MIGGIWCGYGPPSIIIMEPEPNTYILPASCGQTYDIYQSVMSAAFLSAEQQFEWEFTTDNGNITFTALGVVGSSIIELAEVPQLRYNKIYNVRIRARICGIWGPFGGGCFMITGPLPYTYLEPQFCNTIVGPGSSLICEFVANATEYIWQLAPIQCGDPTFTPTGPAQVLYSDDAILWLGEASLTAGACYRVGVKPFVGEQQGDYGQFCQIQILGGMAPPQENVADPFENRTRVEFPDISKSSLYPNPNQGSFNLNLGGVHQDETVNIDIFNASGVLIYTELVLPDYSGARKTYLDLGLPAGFYSARISSAAYTESKHFLVQ